MNDLLFVYGTLMSRFNYPAGVRLRGEAQLLGLATAQGQLFDLGEYPGVVLSDEASDIVHGELYRLRDPAKTLAWLDAYEGIEEGVANPEYSRRLQQVRLDKAAAKVEVWIYLYEWTTCPTQRVLSGRWDRALI